MIGSEIDQVRNQPFTGTCEECGEPMLYLQKHQDLPCSRYHCSCCPEFRGLPCPREQEFGTILDHFRTNLDQYILNALDRKGLFLGYMMLCRYLNHRGYIRYGCNAGYPEDDKHGNAKIHPCPVICPDDRHSLSRIKYHVKKLAKQEKVFIKTAKYYDSKNPYSDTAPKKLDLFTFICQSRASYHQFMKKHTLRRFLEQ